MKGPSELRLVKVPKFKTPKQVKANDKYFRKRMREMKREGGYLR